METLLSNTLNVYHILKQKNYSLIYLVETLIADFVKNKVPTIGKDAREMN